MPLELLLEPDDWSLVPEPPMELDPELDPQFVPPDPALLPIFDPADPLPMEPPVEPVCA